MTKSFSHPLARRAGVWATNIDGKNRDVLVIVTTLELDKKRPRYQRGLVDKLSRAAEERLAMAKGIDSFMLINRPRDWRRNPAGERHATCGKSSAASVVVRPKDPSTARSATQR
jgi:hypothetical protein